MTIYVRVCFLFDFGHNMYINTYAYIEVSSVPFRHVMTQKNPTRAQYKLGTTHHGLSGHGHRAQK